MQADSPAVQQLVRDGLSIVEPIARRLARTLGRSAPADLDDFIGYGQAAVLDAARRFDPAPRAPGNDRDPERLLAQHLAGIAAAQATGVLMQPGLDTQGELLAVSTKTGADEALLRQEMHELLVRGIDTLSPAESALIRRHYLERERLDHIARDLGVSPSKMSRLHASALECLAKLLRPRNPALERA
jgi:RNA polymerase sigma factor (sigma-70 family)